MTNCTKVVNKVAFKLDKLNSRKYRYEVFPPRESNCIDCIEEHYKIYDSIGGNVVKELSGKGTLRLVVNSITIKRKENGFTIWRRLCNTNNWVITSEAEVRPLEPESSSDVGSPYNSLSFDELLTEI